MKSTNTSPTHTTTPPQPWRPPTGIYYEYNRQRPNKPFLLRWSSRDGHSKSQSFADQATREKAAKKLAEDRENFGREILTFDPREWRRWLDFQSECNGTDPMQILSEWRAYREARGLTTGGASVTVADAVTQYLAFRNGGKLSMDTRRHLKKHLADRFASMHGRSLLHAVTAGAINEWLDSLRRTRNPNIGGLVDPLTRRHHRKDVNTFFEWCRRQGWLIMNPCEGVPVPHVDDGDVELLTVEQGRTLFAKNAGRPVVYRMALEAFGFLRASKAASLQKSDVDWEQRGLRLRGDGTKSTKTRYRDRHPDNLWAWLERAPDEAWGMTVIEYRNAKSRAFDFAGLGNSENRLRHTCISAHLAWKKNRPETSELALHTSGQTTEKYFGIMSEADGRAWFGIVP